MLGDISPWIRERHHLGCLSNSRHDDRCQRLWASLTTLPSLCCQSVLINKKWNSGFFPGYQNSFILKFGIFIIQKKKIKCAQVILRSFLFWPWSVQFEACLRHKNSNFVFISASQGPFSFPGSVRQTLIFETNISLNWSFKAQELAGSRYIQETGWRGWQEVELGWSLFIWSHLRNRLRVTPSVKRSAIISCPIITLTDNLFYY